MAIIENVILGQLHRKALSAPGDSLEAPEPPVCTLFEHCKGCHYPAHGFICWVRDGDCMRQTMRKIHGIQEEKRENQSQSFE